MTLFLRQPLVRAPIWGSSPLVDGRVVFGDKAGWLYMIAAEDGRVIWELKIGDNVNATPAIWEGRIYIGAFNGSLHCIGAAQSAGKKKQTAERYAL